MQFFDILVEKDLQLLWNIQNYIRCHERLESFFGHIVSRHPWNDIGALTWVFFIIGVLEFGLVHFWVVISNLIFCYCKFVFIYLFLINLPVYFVLS